MRKLLLLLFLFLFTSTVYADDNTYWNQVLLSDVRAGDVIEYEIGNYGGNSNLSSIDGILYYDSSFLEYLSIEVNKKDGCCYSVSEPNVFFTDEYIDITWDNKNKSVGMYDTLKLKFKVISSFSSTTELRFISRNKTNFTSTLIKVHDDYELPQCPIVEEYDEDLKANDPNIGISISIFFNVVLSVAVIFLGVKKS